MPAVLGCRGSEGACAGVEGSPQSRPPTPAPSTDPPALSGCSPSQAPRLPLGRTSTPWEPPLSFQASDACVQSPG